MALPFSRIERMKTHAQKQVALYDRPKASFFFLIGISSLIATLGLFLNNTAIIIGAMVVAPLLTPIFGMALYVLTLRGKDALWSLFLLLVGTVVALITAVLCTYLVTFLYGNTLVLTTEIIGRTDPNILYFLVALASGSAGAFAYTNKKVMESVAGIAISVAIIPPLAVSGIAFALQETTVMQTSFILYVFNLLGIFLGSIITFLFLGIGKE